MIKIIHLDTGEVLRGGQQQLLMLARGLAARGHQQLIVTLDGTALEARARQEGFRMFALPRHDPAGAHGTFQLRQLLLAEPFQVLHAHDGKGQTISWLASLGLNLKRVASRRVTFAPPRRIDTRLKYGRACDAVIAVSGFIKRLLVDAGVPESQIEIIPDGVEMPDDLPDALARARVRGQWQIGAEDFASGHLGAMTHEKGQAIALRAATRLQEILPRARLVLATGESRSSLTVSQPNVRVLPYQANLSDFFAALDLYIMPSLAEGLGSSALVAMAYGIPVVASRVGGLPELIEEGETGWLIPPGSPQALADAMAHAASDHARLCEMGQKARRRAKQFSSTLMVGRTEALYEKLVWGKGLKSKVEG